MQLSIWSKSINIVSHSKINYQEINLTVQKYTVAWMPIHICEHTEAHCNVFSYWLDDRTDGHSNSRNTFAFKESCSLQNRDIVEVVRTEYIYSRPPPWSDILPTIHIITPTYSRPVQKAELTRLANTLLHVVNLHWILVEDSQRRTSLVSHLLHNTGLNYTHLNVETPRNYKVRGDTRDPRIPRGTIQRNLALRWLRETFSVNNSQPGVVYFADDDNTYSLELFEEVRKFNLAFLIYDFMKHFSSEFMVLVASYKSYLYIYIYIAHCSVLSSNFLSPFSKHQVCDADFTNWHHTTSIFYHLWSLAKCNLLYGFLNDLHKWFISVSVFN